MIIGAAIKIKDLILFLPCPNRHHNIIHQFFDNFEKVVPKHIQGFLNDKGEFLDRESAFIEAERCNQFKKDVEVWGNKLYSENLW